MTALCWQNFSVPNLAPTPPQFPLFFFFFFAETRSSRWSGSSVDKPAVSGPSGDSAGGSPSGKHSLRTVTPETVKYLRTLSNPFGLRWQYWSNSEYNVIDNIVITKISCITATVFWMRSCLEERDPWHVLFSKEEQCLVISFIAKWNSNE